MNRYVPITFSAIFLLMTFLPCQVWAASITETKAAIGEGCTASGVNSTAMGVNTTASGNHSTAMGNGAKAIGDTSTAMGQYTEASGRYSTAMGFWNKAGGWFSFAAGRNMHLTSTTECTFVWGNSDVDESIFAANAFLIFPAGTSGKVGIGTTDPKQIMHMVGVNPRILVEGSTGNPEINFKTSGDAGSAVWALYKNSINNNFHFYQGTNKVTIQNATGNVGIGTSDPGQKLDIAGGSGRVEPGYGWLTSSDQRLKKNIATLEGSLEKISRLRGVRFDSKEAVHVDNGGGKHIGVIAQELEKEYPELVIGDEKTGYKAVAYDKLTAVLIEAVKEMKAQNEKQQAEIEELRLMIKELKS